MLEERAVFSVHYSETAFENQHIIHVIFCNYCICIAFS